MRCITAELSGRSNFAVARHDGAAVQVAESEYKSVTPPSVLRCRRLRAHVNHEWSTLRQWCVERDQLPEANGQVAQGNDADVVGIILRWLVRRLDTPEYVRASAGLGVKQFDVEPCDWLSGAESIKDIDCRWTRAGYAKLCLSWGRIARTTCECQDRHRPNEGHTDEP